MMMLRQEVKLPHEVVFGSSVATNEFETVSNYGVYITELKNKLQNTHDVARMHIEKVAETHKCRYDTYATFTTYVVEDLVWLLKETQEIGKCPKLQLAFPGPYVATVRYCKINFKIQLDGTHKPQVVHPDKLKIHWNASTKLDLEGNKKN